MMAALTVIASASEAIRISVAKLESSSLTLLAMASQK
jgi:hypothetical protein